MKETAASARGHFATMLSGAMDQLDISIRELSKQLGIPYEHARRLRAGEVLPSELLMEKTAAAVGVPVEQLQRAAQRDRILTKYGIFIAETKGASQRVRLLEPLINALDAKQVPTAYAMLKGLVKAAKVKRAVPLAILPREDSQMHLLPKKRAKKKAGVARV
jgi:transcriptional regulator with XRE-family HTH domain